MNANSRQMTLMLFLAPVGYQTAAWRHPQSRVEDLYKFDLPRDVALRAEGSKFHAVFLADWLSFGSTGRNPDLTGYEPFTLMGALSAATKQIGIVGTASTTFVEPYHLARYFSQLDWLSNGRVGWNIVTSTSGEENFQISLPPRDERYARAGEYLGAVKALWDAWADDAVRADRESGVWADNARIGKANFVSEHYQVEGPLLVPRSPQAWPVLVQAGASSAGRDFAASTAEVVFSVSGTYELAAEFYGDLKSRTERAGRRREDIQILPGFMPIVGRDEADARRLYNELADFIDPDVGLKRLSGLLNEVDLSDLDLDETIPAERLDDPKEATALGVASSRYPHFHHLAVEEKRTIRQLIREAIQADGHRVVAGSAEQIADNMTDWFMNGAADGFAILPPTVPVGINSFFDEVVPILQERGLFRRDYATGTLRDNLGLRRPPSRTSFEN